MPVKPSEREEEYFARLELEKKQKAEKAHQENLGAKERARLKDLHYMHCPKCGMKLVEVEYLGIKIDECSECNGVWLDAGELEAVSKLGKTGVDRFLGIFRKN